MKLLILSLILGLFLLKSSLVRAQGDTLYAPIQEEETVLCRDSCTRAGHPFKYKQLIVPVSLTTLGGLGVLWDGFKKYDFGVRDVGLSNAFHFEDALQYVPMGSVYLLNVCGLRGRHNYRDATLILATSYIFMGIVVNSLKYAVKEVRPNGSNLKSFPSGHTATAFMGAEFLHQEYKDVSPWISVAGYSMATLTGLMRIRHNKHWLTDVLAGAGIGMLSTKAAYWLYPTLQRALFGKYLKRQAEMKRNANLSVMGLPYYDGRTAGVVLMMGF